MYDFLQLIFFLLILSLLYLSYTLCFLDLISFNMVYCVFRTIKLGALPFPVNCYCQVQLQWDPCGVFRFYKLCQVVWWRDYDFRYAWKPRVALSTLNYTGDWRKNVKNAMESWCAYQWILVGVSFDYIPEHSKARNGYDKCLVFRILMRFKPLLNK
jgi:hypothetical protein